MKKLTLLTVGTSVLAACSGSSSYDPVFPEIKNTNRVWTDASGQLYSAVQDADGDFTVHDPSNGLFYYYRLENGKLESRPSVAPSIRYENGNLVLGNRTLTPAAVDVETFEVISNGTLLRGMLILPKGQNKVPVVISGQGSERAGALAFDWAPAWYAEAGFGTVLFDKRGTGSSGGNFTHNFDQLGKDIGKVVEFLAAHPRVDKRLIGIAGNSQSVRIATLEASRNSEVDFIVASFGTVGTAFQEELQYTKNKFEAAYPEESWEEFKPFVEACVSAFALRDDNRWDEVSALKKKWKGRVDADKLAGTQVGDGCLSWGPFLLKAFGRGQLPEGLDWSYEPRADIEKLDIPVLWAFGEADQTAPSETSVAAVKAWIDEGKPFELRTYPGADHGMYMTATDKDGKSYRFKNPTFIQDVIAWLKALKAKH